MNILAICCALNNTYFAINYNNQIHSEIIKSDENYHSLYLISKIKDYIKKENINLDKLDAICVNTGPGSFTGIRVAMTLAKVIAGELNLPIIPLNTSEILLNAFDCEILLMDARRDMYFIGTKENIELVYKNKIEEKISNKKLLTDERSKEMFENSICYETENKNLGEIMLELAKNKYQKETDKSKFNFINAEANYIQTPPIFN